MSKSVNCGRFGLIFEMLQLTRKDFWGFIIMIRQGKNADSCKLLVGGIALVKYLMNED